jgi:hypothetical protein
MGYILTYEFERGHHQNKIVRERKGARRKVGKKVWFIVEPGVSSSGPLGGVVDCRSTTPVSASDTRKPLLSEMDRESLVNGDRN